MAAAKTNITNCMSSQGALSQRRSALLPGLLTNNRRRARLDNSGADLACNGSVPLGVSKTTLPCNFRSSPDGTFCRVTHQRGLSESALELLPRVLEQNFVHINPLRLAHGEGDCPRERLGKNRDLRIEVADSLGGLRIGHGVRQFCGHRAR
jgi:hypothetical protein